MAERGGEVTKADLRKRKPGDSIKIKKEWQSSPYELYAKFVSHSQYDGQIYVVLPESRTTTLCPHSMFSTILKGDK